MSAPTVRNVPSPSASLSMRNNDEHANSKYSSQNSDVVKLWLSRMSPPQQCEVPEDGESHSSTADISDDRVIMTLGDLIVADELGNIGTSLRDLPRLVQDSTSQCGHMDYVTDDEDDPSSGDDEEDMLLQSVLLESMASAKKEEAQRYREEDRTSGEDDPAVAVLTLSWADIELDEEEKSSDVEYSSQCHLHSLSDKTVQENSEENSFDCPWTAWYDPPKGRCARLGISRDVYEKKLFEMGVIQCPEDFWIVHEMVDWNNMPCGSMVSFSRIGSKPFWEDPIHHNGGRWIVRGFPRTKSENLFTKAALSLFLGHFPDSQEFTCVSLQVKEKRRPNAIQLWTRTLDYAHVDEIQKHIGCLIEDWEPDVQEPITRGNCRRRGKKNNRSPSLWQLQFEFCPNSESIERNAVKLGDMAPTEPTIRRSKRDRKVTEASMASRCHAVSEMYSEGHLKKKASKDSAKSTKKGGCQKYDWSETLVKMGFGKNRSRSKIDLHQDTITPRMSSSLFSIGELTPEKAAPEKEQAYKLSDLAEHPVSSVDIQRSSSTQKKVSGSSWRSHPTAASNSRLVNRYKLNTCRFDESRRSDFRKMEPNNWRVKTSKERDTTFCGTLDLEAFADGEEPVFIEFDPSLVGMTSAAESGSQPYSEDCGWGQSTIGGGWAPLYANSNFMSLPPTCGTFDSHGCWYPPVVSSEMVRSISEEVSPPSLVRPSLCTENVTSTESDSFLHVSTGALVQNSEEVCLTSSRGGEADRCLCSPGGVCPHETYQHLEERLCSYCWTPEYNYCPTAGSPYSQSYMYSYLDTSTQTNMYCLSQHSSEISRLADSVATQQPET